VRVQANAWLVRPSPRLCIQSALNCWCGSGLIVGDGWAKFKGRPHGGHRPTGLDRPGDRVRPVAPAQLYLFKGLYK
jgi:hypothetical protein